MVSRRLFLRSSAASAAYLAFGAWPAWAANAPGVTDTEIKFGQTMPYSGPASAFGAAGRTEAAYFRMINEQGGINGRKLNFISLDEATARQRPSSRPDVSSNRNRSPSFSGVWARRPT
jgi:branched-chain amino acid transport system substrate-binding protein